MFTVRFTLEAHDHFSALQSDLTNSYVMFGYITYKSFWCVLIEYVSNVLAPLMSF